MERYFGEATPKLGFGLMRLPKDSGGRIDIEQTKKMVDLFLEAGQTYFDTAYVYDDGESEKAAGAALVERHPRESFTLATKVNARVAADGEDARRQLAVSLERTGAGYFDYYLLHALGAGNVELYDKYGLWDFVREQKAKGVIRHWGFSFHDGPQLLDRLLTEHPDAEFVQLQLNYVDWEDPHVAARANYEVARKHGKSVVVMEPVKGGALAEPIPAVREILRGADPAASFASWAIRYAASLDGIVTVLSGMSDVEQMEDNLSYMKNFHPLSAGELKVIDRVREALSGVDSIPCTRCRYCVDGCPMNIPIPQIFAARNRQLLLGQIEKGAADYARAVEGAGSAADCIACGQCEGACPQHLPIIELLKAAARNFG